MSLRAFLYPLLLLLLFQFNTQAQTKNHDTIHFHKVLIGPMPDRSLFTVDTTQLDEKIEKLNISPEEIPFNDIYKVWNNDHVRIKKRTINEIVPTPVTIYLLKQGQFVFPFKGKVISPFGYRGRTVHTGTDIKLNKGDSVLSAFDGVVRLSKRYGAYGKTVVVRHYNGLETVYSHLSKLCVNVNQKVKAGDLVGLGGRTGRASTEHLHFETRYLEEPFNSQHILDFSSYSLYDSTLIITRKTFKMRAKPIHRRGIPAEFYEDDNLKSDSLDTLYAHNWEVPKVDSLKVDSAKMDSLANKRPINPKDTNTRSKTYKPKRHFVGPPIDTIIVFKPKKDEKIKPIKVEPKPLQNSKTKTHVVATKETLYSLSKKYHTTVEKLCKANKLTKNSVLSIGQILIIPKE